MEGILEEVPDLFPVHLSLGEVIAQPLDLRVLLRQFKLIGAVGAQIGQPGSEPGDRVFSLCKHALKFRFGRDSAPTLGRRTHGWHGYKAMEISRRIPGISRNTPSTQATT